MLHSENRKIMLKQNYTNTSWYFGHSTLAPFELEGITIGVTVGSPRFVVKARYLLPFRIVAIGSESISSRSSKAASRKTRLRAACNFFCGNARPPAEQIL